MPRLTLVFAVLVLLLTGGVIAQDDSSVDATGVLQVVDTEPLVGEELHLDTAITIYFDRALDCDTVAGASSITPQITGEFECADDNGSIGLRFDPAESYQPAATYTVTIDTSLRGADGAQLLEPFTLELNTVGFLQVVDVLPAPDSGQIAGDAVITVIFNRPVVPLGSVEDMANLPDPLSFSPEAAGEGEWLNTSIYVFRPEPGWAPATEYTVTVDDDLQAVDGAVMAEPFTWSFTTVPPHLVSVNPEDASSNIRLDPRIQATFNVPVDRDSLEAHFYMRPRGETEGTVRGTFEWSEDRTGFSFRPDELLELNTIYEIGFPAESVFDATESATLPVTRWSVATVPTPAIISTIPRDGEEDASLYGITLYFASPMDHSTLQDKVTIDPEPWRAPDYYYQDYDKTLTVSFPVEPSTDYTITIAPGMADIYGNTIDNEFSFSFSTAPFSPDVQLQAPGAVGFYNAYREETQVFVTHRNISRLDLGLYSVPLSTFIERLTGERYYDLTAGMPTNESTLLRKWQIESVAPLNALRYELLNLGEGGESVVCPGALPPRIRVGDTAIVISDPDPVRARSAPRDGEITGLLYRNYVLPVVGGPVCLDGVLWWEVRLRDESNAWVAESVDEEYLIDLRTAAQTTEVTVTPELADGEALRPGIYYLEVTSPETQRFPKNHLMVVGTANLTMKLSVESVLVWATDVESGLPIAGAPITIYGTGGRAIAEGVTDADGIMKVDIPRVNDLYVPRAAVLQTDEHFGVSVNTWSDGVDPWRFEQPSDFYPRRYHLYMYTDRPVYRPDQPVYFRGVLRAKDDTVYTPTDMQTVPVKIFDDQNEIIYEQDLPLTEFGTFSDTFMLADDTSLGFYRISVDLPSETPYQWEGGSVFFSVAEYRLPEFQVEMTPVESEVVQGSTIEIELESRYFFGGAVSDAQVDYNVIANAHFFNYTGRGGRYDFQEFDYDAGPSVYYGSSDGLVASGTGTTDDQGRLTIEIPADLKDTKQSQRFTIEAVVQDESQQAVAGRVDVVVHQGLVYIGARPETYVGTAGEELTLNLIAVDWESNPVAGQEIDIQIVERRWVSVQEEDPAGRTIWTWEVEEIPVEDGTVTTGSDGTVDYTFVPPTGGIFKAIITSRDETGNLVRASTTVWVSSREYVSWRQQNSNRIDLIADAGNYEVGDTAEILIASPFQGTTEALVTVERGDVLLAEHITMDSNSFVYELPITADFAPNVYVSVMLVKGVDENNPVASFRMGLIQLGVDTAQKELTIEITPDTDQAGPGDTVTYTVRTTDYSGEPVSAEVGVGLTDLASLSIGEPNSPPIMGFFYGQQGISVRTSTPLTINTDQITQTVLDTIKGGGGGFGEGGIFDIRQEFVDTAYWNASLVTGEDGTATFEVTLPDNLTTWRLDARAVTSGEDGLTLVGQDTFDLISTKPLLIRPVTPRFFVVNDEVVLGAVVNNNTENAQSVQVALEGTGVTFTEDAVQTFVIPAGGRQRVNWPVAVDDVANVDLTFFVRSEDDAYTDASKPPLGLGEDRLLPVYRYEAPEIVGTGGLLRDGGSITEAIVLPRRFEVTQGELTINLEHSLAATAIEGLDYLRSFPYSSIETVISRFLPNIMTFRALQSLGIEDAELEGILNLEVQLAVQRLAAQQKVDGGWGWFAQDQSTPLVTAYALIGLSEALDAGFAVDPAMIGRARRFLGTQYITPGLNVEAWRLDRQVFVLYAMARSGSPDVARTVTMYDHRDRLSIYAKALLATTLDIIGNNEDRINTLLSDIRNDAIVSANGTHWEESRRDHWNWNTNTRTTAMVLQLLVRLNPESDLIPQVVRWLMVARTADAWETTQETAWAVMALTDWMVASGELQPDYDYSLAFNDEELATGAATPENVTETQRLIVEVAQMLQDEANLLRFSRTDGEGNLYYTAYLRVFLPVPEIEPLNRGIIVERRYTLLGDENRESITSTHIGQVVQVRLTIIAPNDLHYVVIEDPIPAGTDAINPGLATSQRIGTRPGLDTSDPLSMGWGWWWFSNIEFRDEKVVLSSTYLPAGTYEYVYTIRPGLEGVYNVMPPTGREFYFPDVFGRGAGSTFTILPGE